MTRSPLLRPSAAEAVVDRLLAREEQPEHLLQRLDGPLRLVLVVEARARRS
jgi:hypothetical protein